MGRHRANDVLTGPTADMGEGPSQYSQLQLEPTGKHQREEQPAHDQSERTMFSAAGQRIHELIGHWPDPSTQVLRLAELVEQRAMSPDEPGQPTHSEHAVSPEAQAAARPDARQAFEKAAAFLLPRMREVSDNDVGARAVIFETTHPDTGVTAETLRIVEETLGLHPAPGSDSRMSSDINGVYFYHDRTDPDPDTGSEGSLRLVMQRLPVPEDATGAYPQNERPAATQESPEETLKNVTATQLYAETARSIKMLTADENTGAPKHDSVRKLVSQIEARAAEVGANFLPQDHYDADTERKVVRTGLNDALVSTGNYFNTPPDRQPGRWNILTREEAAQDYAGSVMQQEIEAVLGAHGEGVLGAMTVEDGRSADVLTKPTDFEGVMLQEIVVQPAVDQDGKEVKGARVLRLVKSSAAGTPAARSGAPVVGYVDAPMPAYDVRYTVPTAPEPTVASPVSTQERNRYAETADAPTMSPETPDGYTPTAASPTENGSPKRRRFPRIPWPGRGDRR
jgi:hypothetical protein